MEQDVKTLKDLKEILGRRRWSLILPMVIIFLISAIVAFSLPPNYRSTATILIEEQEIPKEYVMSMVTSYADQRLQAINQRIMSASRLLEIINRFNLYPELRRRWTVEEVIEEMREDIKFETISADVVDRRTGRPTAATIAFTVSYEGKNPTVVQQVANTLASLYLEENLRVREEKTAGASKFIEEELKEIQTSLAQQDAKIAAYKQRHLNALPEMTQLNIQELDRVERGLEQLEIQVKTLKEREGVLQTQLASIPPDLANPDKERLKELRVKLVFLRNRYTDQYPDVIKTKAEIEELERKLKVTDGGPIGDKPDNPAYIHVASQLASVQAEIDSLKKQMAALQAKREEYRRRIQVAPRVEEGYKALMAERNNLQSKYDDLMKKYMETKVAHGLEREQMGEKFTLIDPPRLPEKPVSPNIPAILLIGLILGIGGGVGTASLKEHSDRSVKGETELARATGFPVLVSIPEIQTQQDLVRLKRRRMTILFSVAALVVVSILIFHFFIMDLDVFWARFTRRLGI